MKLIAPLCAMGKKFFCERRKASLCSRILCQRIVCSKAIFDICMVKEKHSHHRQACADIRIGTMSDAFRSDAIFCYCSNLNIQIDKAGNGRPRSFLPFRVFEWLPSFQLTIFSAKAPLGLFADCYSRPV